jgi:Zn-dependent oligopeptidase
MRSVWAGILLLSLVVDLYGGAFHELGHALHCILTRAKYSRFAGTHVPVDFVQAPSQMLQNWIWDEPVLDTFAADHRDRTKKIPDETVKKMNNAKLATAAMFTEDSLHLPMLILLCTARIPRKTRTIALRCRIRSSSALFSRLTRRPVSLRVFAGV